MIDRPDNINIFILYATEDQALKEELEGHLSFLQRLGYIDVWHEGQVQPGVEKQQVVSEYLEKAHIILLLISANFLAPDQYSRYEDELRRAYERQKEGKVVIIPVILRHCVWQLDILAGLNPLPSGGYPVRSDHWESVDKAFHDITIALQKVAAGIKDKSQSTAVAPETPGTVFPLQKKDTPVVYGASSGTLAADKSTKPAAINSFQALLHDLFDALFSHSIEAAVHSFIPIAHRSLVSNKLLDPYFQRHNFNAAFERARMYRYPPEVVAKQTTGRHKIGPRNDKDEGEEYACTLARVQDTGGMPGQVRIFQSLTDGSLKISGLSL